MARRPGHLPRTQTVKLSLVRGNWENVRTDDLWNSELAGLFTVYRHNPALKKIVKGASEEDRDEILQSIPALIGDYYVDRDEFPKAIAAYLKCASTDDAILNTQKLVKEFAAGRGNIKDAVLQTIRFWKESKKAPKHSVSLVLELFHSPETVAKARFKDCMTELGRPVIILAVDQKENGRTLLYDISPSEFHVEVGEDLYLTYLDYVKVVEWFCQRKGATWALDFVKRHRKKLSGRMMRDIVVLVQDLSPWLYEEAYRRGVIGELILHLLSSDVPTGPKEKYVSAIIGAIGELKDNCESRLSLLSWCFWRLPQKPHRKSPSQVVKAK